MRSALPKAGEAVAMGLFGRIQDAHSGHGGNPIRGMGDSVAGKFEEDVR